MSAVYRTQVPQLLQELASVPVILRERGSGSEKSGMRLLESVGITDDQLQIVARMKDQAAMINMVKEGIGVAIISEKSVKYRTDKNKFLTFELEGETGIRHLYIIHSRNQMMKEEIREFMKYVMQFAD